MYTSDDEVSSLKVLLPMKLIVIFYNKVINKTGKPWDGVVDNFNTKESINIFRHGDPVNLNDPNRSLFFSTKTNYTFVCPVDGKTYSVNLASFREYNTNSEKFPYFKNPQEHSYTILWIRFVLDNLPHNNKRAIGDYCYKMKKLMQMTVKNLHTSMDNKIAELDLSTPEGQAKKEEIIKTYTDRIKPYADLCTDLDKYACRFGHYRRS